MHLSAEPWKEEAEKKEKFGNLRSRFPLPGVSAGTRPIGLNPGLTGTAWGTGTGHRVPLCPARGSASTATTGSRDGILRCPPAPPGAPHACRRPEGRCVRVPPRTCRARAQLPTFKKRIWQRSFAPRTGRDVLPTPCISCFWIKLFC